MDGPGPRIDFSDTQVAFSSKTDKELKRTAWLFKMMNNSTLVKVGSSLASIAIKFKLPFTKAIIRNTVYEHFCGGRDIFECQPVIDKLYRNDTLTILDFGAESKSNDEDHDRVKDETLRAIEFAASNDSVPVVSTKLTGMADDALLEAAEHPEKLTDAQKHSWQKLYSRVDEICRKGFELKVGVFIDAEYSWMQVSIDRLVKEMMEKYNGDRAIVYGTYQLYRKDKLQQLKDDFDEACAKSYILGAKLVRGAYMEKERERAMEMGYPSPIHENKENCDKDYNEAVLFCVEHYEQMASCNASHNLYSNQYMAELIDERNILKNHPHLNFCQLYGMSDYITFNLAQQGYNVAKYLPYGPVEEVIPYLIRRAEENTSITGEMSRELSLISKELIRRGLKKE